jgi:hypothetical protein
MRAHHLALILIATALSSSPAFAYGSGGGGGGSGGGWSIGLDLGLVNASQDSMNEIIKRANTGTNGPVSTSQMNSAYEFAPFITYRYTGTIFAVQLRPSIFYQSETGSGDNGAYDFSVQGWTLFPMLRLYPLESDIMKFYMQFGLGYGRMTGKISEGAGNSVTFESGAFGSVVGLGAEFCFTPNHCMNLESDYRYLTFERSKVTASSGTLPDLTQYSKNDEIEMDGSDLSVRMGGLMFMFGYTYWF